MKETLKYFCLYLVAAFLFSCRPHQYPHILLEADSLCEANPDSAVSLLRHLHPQFSSGSEADQMYYQLLCIKAADKAYLPLPTDSTILNLVDYYESNHDRERLPEVYFYAARIFSDRNDSPEALDYLQKGAESMTASTKGKLRTLIYYHMGTLFVFQNLTDQALQSYEKALNSCEEGKDTLSMIYVLREKGFCLARKKEIEKEYACYQKALSLAESMKDSNMVFKIKAQMAICLNDKGNHEKALLIIREVVDYNDVDEHSSTYSIASRIYEDLGMHDSAVYYCHRMYSEGNLYAKRDASNMLAKDALNRHDALSAYRYVASFDSLSDSIHKSDAAASVAQMNALFNYQLREKENMALSISNKNKTISIVIIILVSVILMGVLCVLWINKKRQMQVGLEKLKRMKDEELAKSQEMIGRNKCEIEMLRKELDSTDNENESLKQELKEKEKRLVHMVALAEMENQQRATALKKLETSDIIGVIHRLANDNSTMEISHWQLLEEEVNRNFPDFHKKLYALFAPSNHEYHVVLLMKAKLTTVQIATLTARSKQAISSSKARMYQKAFGKKGKAEEWERIVYDF